MSRLEKLLKIITGALLFLLPWQTILITREAFLNGAKWQYGTLGWYATEILLWTGVVLFVFWYIKKWRAHKEKPHTFMTPDREFAGALLLFVLYAFAGSIWAMNGAVAYQHALHMLEGVLFFFVLFLGPLPFRSAAVWFIFGALVQSVFGLVQFLLQAAPSSALFGLAPHVAWEAGSSIVSGDALGRWLRAYGAFPHPNVFGGYLSVSLLLCVFLFHLLAKENGKEKKNARLRLFCIVAVVLQAAALSVSFSRTAWLSATAVFGLSLFLVFHRTRAWAPVLQRIGMFLGALLLILVALFPLVYTRVAASSPSEHRSVVERVAGAGEAAGISQQSFSSFWFGVGAGNYTLSAFALHPAYPGWAYQPVHSVPLLILVELGIVGSALLLLCAILFLRYVSMIVSFDEKKKQALLLLFFAPIVLLLLFDHYLFSSYVGLLFTGLYFGLGSRALRDI